MRQGLRSCEEQTLSTLRLEAETLKQTKEVDVLVVNSDAIRIAVGDDATLWQERDMWHVCMSECHRSSGQGLWLFSAVQAGFRAWPRAAADPPNAVILNDPKKTAAPPPRTPPSLYALMACMRASRSL